MHDPAARTALGVVAVKERALAGAKRARAAGTSEPPSSVGDEREVEGCVGESSAGSAAAPPSAAAIGAAFKGASALLTRELATPAGRFAIARHRKASALLAGLRSRVPALTPNARTYILAIKAAVGAGAAADARALLSEAMEAGALSRAGLYEHAQPSFIRELADSGVIEMGDDLLSADPGSPKDAFLLAASAATRGDQQGSKHGAAVVRDGRVLSVGHNHRFGLPGDPHLRVMHAEVHALVQMMPPLGPVATELGRIPETVSEDDLASAARLVHGCDVYIVELDGYGVGYEEAVPCPMCQSVVCALGVGRACYSSHSGVVVSPVAHKPCLQCVSFQMARRRVYPKGTVCPDGPPRADASVGSSQQAAGGGALRDSGGPVAHAPTHSTAGAIATEAAPSE